MQMPWGKYRGVELDEVPEDYLLWVLDRADNAGEALKAAIRKVLGLDPAGASGKPEPPRPPPPPRPPKPPPPPAGVLTLDRVQAAVKAWWRRVVLDHHPDRGGSTAIMAALNNAKEELDKFLADLK